MTKRRLSRFLRIALIAVAGTAALPGAARADLVEVAGGRVIVRDDNQLLAAYLRDVGESRMFLGVSEGFLAAERLGVVAAIKIVESEGVLADGDQVGLGGKVQGTVLFNDDHYSVLIPVDPAIAQFLDEKTGGYFREVPIKGDGHCLLRSLFYIKNGREPDLAEIGQMRKQLASDLRDPKWRDLLPGLIDPMDNIKDAVAQLVRDAADFNENSRTFRGVGPAVTAYLLKDESFRRIWTGNMQARLNRELGNALDAQDLKAAIDQAEKQALAALAGLQEEEVQEEARRIEAEQERVAKLAGQINVGAAPIAQAKQLATIEAVLAQAETAAKTAAKQQATAAARAQARGDVASATVHQALADLAKAEDQQIDALQTPVSGARALADTLVAVTAPQAADKAVSKPLSAAIRSRKLVIRPNRRSISFRFYVSRETKVRLRVLRVKKQVAQRTVAAKHGTTTVALKVPRSVLGRARSLTLELVLIGSDGKPVGKPSRKVVKRS